MLRTGVWKAGHLLACGMLRGGVCKEPYFVGHARVCEKAKETADGKCEGATSQGDVGTVLYCTIGSARAGVLSSGGETARAAAFVVNGGERTRERGAAAAGCGGRLVPVPAPSSGGGGGSIRSVVQN